MSDTPVHPLTLYRLTLETDDFGTFNYFNMFFKDIKHLVDSQDLNWLNTYKKFIIGVESRVRERME